MDSLIALLRKVKVLADQGVNGEREAAKAKLAALLKKHNIQLDQLLEPAEPRWVLFKTKTLQEREILTQCALTTLGVDTLTVRQHRGRHSIARTRYDAWFTGPDNRRWHGVRFGDRTEICHCNRLA